MSKFSFCTDSITERLSVVTAALFGLPMRCGKLRDLTKFDATFFGVHAKQADTMDPQIRMLLEVTHEAIVDAGKPFVTISPE